MLYFSPVLKAVQLSGNDSGRSSPKSYPVIRSRGDHDGLGGFRLPPGDLGESTFQGRELLLTTGPIVPGAWMNVGGDVNSNPLGEGMGSLNGDSKRVSIQAIEEVLERTLGSTSVEVIEENSLFSFVSIEPVEIRNGDELGLGVPDGSGLANTGGTKEKLNPGLRTTGVLVEREMEPAETITKLNVLLRVVVTNGEHTSIAESIGSVFEIGALTLTLGFAPRPRTGNTRVLLVRVSDGLLLRALAGFQMGALKTVMDGTVSGVLAEFSVALIVRRSIFAFFELEGNVGQGRNLGTGVRDERLGGLFSLSIWVVFSKTNVSVLLRHNDRRMTEVGVILTPLLSL